MGLFDKIKEPVFLKESSSLSEQLAVLEELSKKCPPESAKKVEQELRNVKAGLIGEQQIAFELRNSHMPMYVLHDLYLEHEGLTAQIDYLVMTRGRNFVIECKNLYGNIVITDQGDFIRNIGYSGTFFKERIYSPVTQNERHMALIKQIRAAQRTNVLSRALFERGFSTNYRSLVVLANPKTVLNDRYATQEIKDQVVPVDRLVTHLKKVNAEKGAEEGRERDMVELAEFFLSIDQPHPDYTARYREQFGIVEALKAVPARKTTAKAVPQAAPPAPETERQVVCPRCGAPMVLRTASKGNNAGNSFYGCSRYPKCRGIVNAE